MLRLSSTVCHAVAAMALASAMSAQAGSPGELFPAREPSESGQLRVSDVHEIYYSLHGNPKGKSVFVLHGGRRGERRPVRREVLKAWHGEDSRQRMRGVE